MKKVFLLSGRVPWFGSHTGYELFAEPLLQSEEVEWIKTRKGYIRRILGKLWSVAHGWGQRDQYAVAAGLDLFSRVKRFEALGHLVYLEQYLHLLTLRSAPVERLIATIHLPLGQWSDEMKCVLENVRCAIILANRERAEFEGLMRNGRVVYIPHCVDTQFFRPPGSMGEVSRRLLFSGVYLRNTAMLRRLIERLHAIFPEVHFDLLVPSHGRNDEHLKQLVGHPAVHWHAGLTDEQLRGLYQKTYLMLLPMNQSAANTAIVEALASGIPIATTDVGGIRDYGGAKLFPVVENDDDDAMVTLISRFLAQPEWRHRISAECRAFAEQELAKESVARLHYEVYTSAGR